MGDCQNEDLRVGFDRRLKLKFLGSQITTDAGLLAYRELDETLGLTEMGADVLTDCRLGSNKQHQLVPLLRHAHRPDRRLNELAQPPPPHPQRPLGHRLSPPRHRLPAHRIPGLPRPPYADSAVW